MRKSKNQKKNTKNKIDTKHTKIEQEPNQVPHIKRKKKTNNNNVLTSETINCRTHIVRTYTTRRRFRLCRTTSNCPCQIGRLITGSSDFNSAAPWTHFLHLRCRCLQSFCMMPMVVPMVPVVCCEDIGRGKRANQSQTGPNRAPKASCTVYCRNPISIYTAISCPRPVAFLLILRPAWRKDMGPGTHTQG